MLFCLSWRIYQFKCVCVYTGPLEPGVAKGGLPPLPPNFWLLMFFIISDSKKKLKKCYVLKTEILHRLRKRSHY